MGTSLRLFPGSVDNLPELLNIIKKESIDTIFHLGGMLSMPSENKPWASFQANVVGTFTVMEAARLEGVDKVIYSSTIATYSKDIRSSIIDDITLQRPTTMYGATKVFGELLGRVYARKYGIDFRGFASRPWSARGKNRPHVHLPCMGHRGTVKGKSLRNLCRARDKGPRDLF